MHRIVYDMYQEIVAEMNARQQVYPVCASPRGAKNLEVWDFPFFSGLGGGGCYMANNGFVKEH